MQTIESLLAEIEVLTRECDQYKQIADSESAHSFQLGMELEYATSKVKKLERSNKNLWEICKKWDKDIKIWK